MPSVKRDIINKRRTKVVDDIELVIIEHDLCYHCREQLACLRKDLLTQTANQQELGFVVTRCPDYDEP
jgi:hypothetical protein